MSSPLTAFARCKLDDDVHQSIRADWDSRIREVLHRLIDMPLVGAMQGPAQGNLGLEIVVPRFQSRDIRAIAIGHYRWSVMARPRIQLAARLFKLDTGETLHTAGVQVQMPWLEYVTQYLAWKQWFQASPHVETADVERLLVPACLTLFQRLRDVL